MTSSRKGRREFLKSSLTTAAAMSLTPSSRARAQDVRKSPRSPRIRFAAIGLNHSHIYGQVDAVIRGGGELISFFAKEPDLAASFSKRFPTATLARSEKEILDDQSIQLVVSASIPNERAPLGIEVMRRGKDFMSDKPGMTTLEQLAEVRRVQAETRRIHSILYGTAGFSVTSRLTSSISSCSSPDRRQRKWSPPRSGTCITPSIPSSKTSATSCCAATVAAATFVCGLVYSGRAQHLG